jgi:FKBP-type peptidyl-prolyl cis-trans isomerase (trigger factor)
MRQELYVFTADEFHEALQEEAVDIMRRMNVLGFRPGR